MLAAKGAEGVFPVQVRDGDQDATVLLDFVALRVRGGKTNERCRGCIYEQNRRPPSRGWAVLCGNGLEYSPKDPD